MSRTKKRAPTSKDVREATQEETRPDWKRSCELCGNRPVVPITGMCGPCTFGESDTEGGNW